MLVKKEINGYSTLEYHHKTINWIEKDLLGRELTLIEKVRLGEYVEPALETYSKDEKCGWFSKPCGLVEEISSRFLNDYYGIIPDGNMDKIFLPLLKDNPNAIFEYFQSIQRKAHMPEL